MASYKTHRCRTELNRGWTIRSLATQHTQARLYSNQQSKARRQPRRETPRRADGPMEEWAFRRLQTAKNFIITSKTSSLLSYRAIQRPHRFARLPHPNNSIHDRTYGDVPLLCRLHLSINRAKGQALFFSSFRVDHREYKRKW